VKGVAQFAQQTQNTAARKQVLNHLGARMVKPRFGPTVPSAWKSLLKPGALERQLLAFSLDLHPSNF
jgi:hypothetical protein